MARRGWFRLGLAMIAAFVACGPSRPEPSPAAAPADCAACPADLPSFAALFRQLAPSVVNIFTREAAGRDERPSDGLSLGSGMVLDQQGHILTSAHVVEGASEIRVRFHDHSDHVAQLVGLDGVRDLALVKVAPSPSLVPVVAGAASELQVGQWVVAIGNPLGWSHSMTKGIVSGKGRSEFVTSDTGYVDLIQSDAVILPGSSGGPLFDLRGRVVGINTALDPESRGLGFAIPWESVADALPRLRKGGQVSRSWLGIFLARTGSATSVGASVAGVVDGSPAAKAGIVAGDVVVALDDRPVPSAAEFRLVIGSAVAGRTIHLGLIRDGETITVSATLEEARGPR